MGEKLKTLVYLERTGEHIGRLCVEPPLTDKELTPIVDGYPDYVFAEETLSDEHPEGRTIIEFPEISGLRGKKAEKRLASCAFGMTSIIVRMDRDVTVDTTPRRI